MLNVSWNCTTLLKLRKYLVHAFVLPRLRYHARRNSLRCHCSRAALKLFHEPPHPPKAPRARPAAQAAHGTRGHHELSVAEARRYHVRPRPARTLDTTTLASSRHCARHRAIRGSLLMDRKTGSPSPRSRSRRSALPPACTRPSRARAAAAPRAAAPGRTPRRSAPS